MICRSDITSKVIGPKHRCTVRITYEGLAHALNMDQECDIIGITTDIREIATITFIHPNGYITPDGGEPACVDIILSDPYSPFIDPEAVLLYNFLQQGRIQEELVSYMEAHNDSND